MYQGQPWHRYCKTSDNRVSRSIGPNGAYPDVTRLSGIYCNTIPWLHGTHQNGIPFLAKLEQAYRDRWFSRPQLSESSDHPLTLEEEERRPSLLHSPREKSHMALGLEISWVNAGARNHHFRLVRSICYAE